MRPTPTPTPTIATAATLALLLISALALSLLLSAPAPADPAVSNQQIWDKLVQLEAKIDALSAAQEATQEDIRTILFDVEDIRWTLKDIEDELMWCGDP